MALREDLASRREPTRAEASSLRTTLFKAFLNRISYLSRSRVSSDPERAVLVVRRTLAHREKARDRSAPVQR